MLGFQTYWEPVAIGVDALIVYLLYRAYKSRGKEADLLAATPTYDVRQPLLDAVNSAPGKALDYVCVQGVTKVVGEPLRSQFTSEAGVIQHQMLVEHKSKRTNGAWSDIKTVIRDVFNFRPFYIIDSESDLSSSSNDYKVEVTDLLSAEYLNDYLPVIHDNYSPAKDGLFSRGMDLMLGEVTKGYQETEKFLSTGSNVLAVGCLTLEGKRLLLQPPSDGRRYIVTPLSKPEVIRSLRSNAKAYKILVWIFFIIGTGIFSYSIYKFIKKLMQERESQRVFEEIRRLRQTTPNNGNESSSESEQTRCIVCLTNTRDTIILNCGHVCLCLSCATALPEPKKCPICRSRVTRFQPVYVS